MRAELPPDFDGCGWKCRTTAKHCEEWGTCAHASEPPCEHPIALIRFNPATRRVECYTCGEHLTVRKLAEEARVAVSMGCWCSDECPHDPKPMGWTLNPLKILAILQAEDEA